MKTFFVFLLLVAIVLITWYLNLKVPQDIPTQPTQTLDTSPQTPSTPLQDFPNPKGAKG